MVGRPTSALRGLGPTATLVLLDGKRLTPANGTGVVDLNIVPSSLIESVEIITGGASAVYGSDALAGVVNFKLKQDFDGAEVDGSWAQTDRGDGAQYEAGLTAGTDFAGGRGSVVGFVGYADRELVTQGDRGFSRYAMRYAGYAPDGQPAGTLGPGNTFLPLGSTNFIEEGRVSLNGPNRPTETAFNSLMATYGLTPEQARYAILDEDGNIVSSNTQFGFNDDGSVFTTGNQVFLGDLVPAVANFRGPVDPVFFNPYVYSYNFAPPNALQLPLERTSAFLRADFELTENARLYLQGLYSDYSATVQLAPTLISNVRMPVTNPYIPADMRGLLQSRPLNPDAPFFLSKRVAETGPRTGTNSYDVYQVTLGVDGSIFDDWKYDVYAQVGANDQQDHQTGNILLSRIIDLVEAPDGGASVCGGLDLFGKGSISQECLAYVSTDASNHASVDQAVAEASVTGPLFEMPAGELVAAFGVFYKKDEYSYRASPESKVFLDDEGNPSPDGTIPDIQGFVASDDIDGDDHNLDLYMELLVPVLRDRPGVRSLDAVVGYRSSDYASAGRFDSWKGELLYQPVQSLRLRASYQEAVRAPSVFELYQPQLPAMFSPQDADFPFVDPCSAGSPERDGADGPAVEALCLAQGMPAGVLPDFADDRELVPGVSGGNPGLHQEEASTTTLGLVWTSQFSSAWVSQLQLSLDWYDIDIDDKIDTVFFDRSVPYCYDRRYNADLSSSNLWCSLIHRDPASGLIDDLQEISTNAYDWQTSGIDVQADWRFDAGPGQVGVSWLVSWLDSFSTRVVDSSVPANEYAGMIGRGVGGALPEWKSNLHLSYAWHDLTVGTTWRYVDSMTDADPELDPRFRIPSASYFGLDAAYELSSGPLAGLLFNVGVENLSDEDPPIFPSNVQANTDPSQYDVLGRRYYASLRYSF